MKSWKAANKEEPSADEETDEGEEVDPPSRQQSRYATTSSTWSKDESKEVRDKETKKTMDTMKVPTTFNEMLLCMLEFSSSVAKVSVQCRSDGIQLK